MFTLILFVVGLIGAGLTIAIRKLKGIRRVNILAGWLLACSIGLGGVWAFIGHAFFPSQVAQSIGWSTSPFQWEIAMANLSIGTLGLLSIFFQGRFRLATAIACNVYLLGCAVGHIQQAIAYGNFEVNNVGPILWIGDIFSPLLILALVIIEDLQVRQK